MIKDSTQAFAYRSAREWVGLIRSKEITPLELMEMTLARIEADNPAINAFVDLRAEQSLDEARVMTDRLAAGKDLGPLGGIPIGVKELEDVAGMVTSFGSTIYKDHIAAEDSVQVKRLKRAGAIVVGKTNIPEFGFTFFTTNRIYGVTRNPWDLKRTPGGSSGGSAAAVVAGMVPIATGSDYGGSIRTPAAYTGCFGLKTSFGRIPSGGFAGPLPLLPMHSIAVTGPLTRSVEDAALFLDCVAGAHPCDPDSLPAPDRSYLKCLQKIPARLKIAFSPTLGYAKVQNDVMRAVEKAVNGFEEMGHCVEIWRKSLPDVADDWFKLLACDFYAQIQQDLEQNRQELGRSMVASLEGLKSFSLKDRIAAQKTKTELNRVLWELFDQFDLLMTPTMPTDAFDAKGPPPSEIDGVRIPLLGSLAFTYPFNLAGNPAANVPAGFTEKGLPAGLQIIGPRLRDDRVLQAAFAFEQARPWKDRWPAIK
jgi:aspartyl-tRNA(Asn)/glutamyl-tRNA(Gln) amidotransferase subunit A